MAATAFLSTKHDLRSSGQAWTFRPDVEGLRALAVVSVLLYHAGVRVFSGGYVGVDVFFVISGYLITGLLLREMEQRGRVSLLRFYARRAKRLLPTLAVVLVTVSVLAWLWLPPVRRASTYLDVVASGLYVVNWWLASRAVDYAAVSASVSPVQHLWSLAVEEQFYLVWPPLMLATTFWWRRRGRLSRPALVAALLVVSAVSFRYCVEVTDAQAGLAYFSTLARAWELGVGGVLAVATARWTPARRTSAGLWLLGVAAVLYAIVDFDDTTLFPGARAAVPVLGTAAMIAAGSGAAASRRGPQRLLTLRPVRHVGRVSYTWYLWHWPLLVFAEARWGDLSVPVAVAVVAAAYLPTILTHRLVEEPFRRSVALSRVPARAVRLGLLCTALIVAPALVLRWATPVLPTAGASAIAGAKSLRGSASTQKSVSAVRPAPETAGEDRGKMYFDCLRTHPQTFVGSCAYGDTRAPTTVVLFGDSHAMQWAPALTRVAERRHWRLVGLGKAGCPPADVRIFNDGLRREYTECATWRSRALDRIRRIRPDMVVVSSLTDYTVIAGGEKQEPAASRERLRAGYRSVLEQLQRVSRRVVVVGDVPHHMEHADDCVAAHAGDLEACAVARADARAPQPLLDATRGMRHVRRIDPTPQFCPGAECPAVIGNVLVYRNSNHITATYAATLDDWFDRRLPQLR